MSLQNSTSYCWFDVDPQSLPVQIVGYLGAAGVIGHAIPTLVKVAQSKNPSHVPLGSLVVRILVGIDIAVFGLLICQTPNIVSGVGSLLVLLPIAILKIIYRKKRRGREQRKDDLAKDQMIELDSIV